MSTRRDVGKALAVRTEQPGLDDYTAMVCLTRSLGDVLRMRETATNARTYFIANLVSSAVFEKDMALIEILATRIDGTVPTSSERDSFANLMGDAIDDVLDMERSAQMTVIPDDPVIIALAKVVFHIATSPTRGNPTLKREKQKAVEMVYARTAGRRTEPVRPLLETKYVKPQWLSEITEEEEDGGQQADHDQR